MKKRIIILAAVAVSGLAAVVASNNKIFFNNEADANTIEVKNGSSYSYCVSGGYECCIPGHGWELVVHSYYNK